MEIQANQQSSEAPSMSFAPVAHHKLLRGRAYENHNTIHWELALIASSGLITAMMTNGRLIFRIDLLPSSSGLLPSSSVKWAIFRKSMVHLSVILNLDATEQVKRFFPFQVALVPENGGRAFFAWSILIDCSYLEVPTDSWTNSPSWNNENSVRRLLDSKGLTWPYPEEQTEWLLRSLGNLKGDVLEMVKYLDGKWTIGHPVVSAGLEKLNLTSDVTSDNRILDSLDLAFLGRLLVYLDQKEKIPGQEPPPHTFPDHWRALVVSRQLQN